MRRSAEGVLDPTLSIYSLIGLSAANLALGEVVNADFLAARAFELASRMGNPQDVAASEIQIAATRSAAADHEGSEVAASSALRSLIELGAGNAVRAARYRLALSRFRAGHKAQAEDALADLAGDITAPWMMGALRPALKLDPMFAQWAASRTRLPASFRLEVGRQLAVEPEAVPPPRTGTYPKVQVRSLGPISVTVDGTPVGDRRWATARARELFFVFLAHPEGLRKEEAVLSMFPDLPSSRCNSAFHSNLHRVRRALYQESVVVQDGIYRLNPDAEFEWDVRTFLDQLHSASDLPAGSDERAQAMEQALKLYIGPFAGEFYSEWADSIREQAEHSKLQALGALAGFYAGRGDFGTAASHLEQILAASPYNDEAAHELACYQARAGNTVVAIGLIDEFARRIDRDLAQPLPARLRQLRAAIATGRAV
jgi:DNA-binding SARP family transcriptional activator